MSVGPTTLTTSPLTSQTPNECRPAAQLNSPFTLARETLTPCPAAVAVEAPAASSAEVVAVADLGVDEAASSDTGASLPLSDVNLSSPPESACVGSSSTRLLDDTGVSSCVEHETACAVHLALGSADPHGLGFEERSAAPRRRPSCSPLDHFSASSEELLSREMPTTNVPPCTEDDSSSPPSSVHDPSQTTFGSVDEVIPKHTMALVNHWRRRLRRCLRYASRGNASMARRLRPPDLWLAEEQHTLPAAHGLVVDFRPLDRGERACVLPASHAADPPSTSLIADEVRAAAADFADRVVVRELCDGIEDDTCVPRGTLLCAPHASALADFAVASGKLQKNMTEGWAFEHSLPFWPLRCCPYGLVDESEKAGKPKWRLTQDLSWPPPLTLPDNAGGFVCSHNDSMDRSRWPVNPLIRVRDLADAAAIMRASGAPVHLWSLDGQAFYRSVGRQRSELWRCALPISDGFQVDERCCFGSAADATKCSRFSNLIVHAVRRELAAIDAQFPSRDEDVLRWQAARRRCGLSDDLHFFGMYIDDALASSFADLLFNADGSPLMREGVHLTRAQLHFEAARKVFARIGVKSAPEKEQPPSLLLIALGIELDLESESMRLGDDKRKRYRSRVQSVLAADAVPFECFRQLLGRLQFATTCYPRARQWLQAPWRLSRAQFRRRDGMVPLTDMVRASLEMWDAALASRDALGVPLASAACFAAVSDPTAAVVYADASGNEGWAAWTARDGEVLCVAGEWSESERTLGIAEKELFASTAGLLALVERSAVRDVYSFTDNMVALGCMRNSRARDSARLQALVSARIDALAARGLREAAERVGSRSNLWADLGSRPSKGGIAAVKTQAEALGWRFRRVSTVPGWDNFEWLLFVPEY